MDHRSTEGLKTREKSLFQPRKASGLMMFMIVLQWAVFSLVFWNAVNAEQDDPFEVFIFPLVFVLPALFLLTIRTPITWMLFCAILFALAIPMYVAGMMQIFMYIFDGTHWTLFTKAAASSLPLFGLMVVLSQMRPLRHYYHVRSILAKKALFVFIGIGILFVYVIVFR